MNTLLKSECFDHFLLQEATIQGAVTFHVDGRIRKDFFSPEEGEELGLLGCEFLPYSQLRQNCFDLIKGKKTPGAFSFVFLLSPENLERTLIASATEFTAKDVSAMAMTVRYSGGELMLTTGISYRSFIMDKSLDEVWDVMVQKFLTKNEIEFDLL